MPQAYPRFTPAELAALRPLGYRELAFAVLSRFIDDIPPADLKADHRHDLYAGHVRQRRHHAAATLAPGLHLLRVSNGPTLAFKDIALQLLGNLFEYVLARANGSINILGATSGDTGSSAEYAMRGKRGIAVFMLSPQDRMSPFQQAQMFSLADPNIFNLAVDGTFDDCQDLVKAVANDAHVQGALEDRRRQFDQLGAHRGAGRLLFQGLFRGDRRTTTQHVDFAVPSGNFGNILAAHVARQMGLPIRRLILATNENDVLDEFFRTGRYRPRSAARNACDVVAVDGHFEGVQLRALRLRRDRP